MQGLGFGGLGFRVWGRGFGVELRGGSYGAWEGSCRKYVRAYEP